MLSSQATGGLDPTPPKPGAVALGIAPHSILVISSALAWVLARRDRRHRPVAVALTVIAVASIVRLAIGWTVLAEPGPYTGWTRAVFHVEQALYLASTVALPWLTWATLGWATWDALPPSYRGARTLHRSAVFGFASACGALVAGYPGLRGEALRRVYLAYELGSLFVCALAIVSWLRRRASPSLRHRERGRELASVFAASVEPETPPGQGGDVPPGPSEPRWYTVASALCMVGASAALLAVGAWPRGLFGQAYMLQQAGLLGLYGAIVGVHVVALALTRRKAS